MSNGRAACQVRLLLNRAALRGGLAINIAGMCWMLLKALGASPEEWDHLLHFSAGQLPADQDQMNALIDRTRCTGHLYGGGATGDGGFQRQGTAGDPGNYLCLGACNVQVDPEASECWSYFSGTESDAGELDPEAARVYNTCEVDGVMRGDSVAIGNQVYQDYALAKQRWRRFTPI